jgi:hypothetical protein
MILHWERNSYVGEECAPERLGLFDSKDPETALVPNVVGLRQNDRLGSQRRPGSIRRAPHAAQQLVLEDLKLTASLNLDRKLGCGCCEQNSRDEDFQFCNSLISH